VAGSTRRVPLTTCDTVVTDTPAIRATSDIVTISSAPLSFDRHDRGPYTTTTRKRLRATVTDSVPLASAGESAIGRALTLVRRGGRRILGIAGPPGAGKTTLAQQLAERVRTRAGT